jgi:hypothetical protein
MVGNPRPHTGPFLSASNDAAPIQARVFLTPLPMSLLANVFHRKMASYRRTGRQPPEGPDRLALATRRGERFTVNPDDFNATWATVTVELPMKSGEVAVVEANVAKPSFTKDCPHLIEKGIGRWLRNEGYAPWPTRKPPKFSVEAVGDARFRVKPIVTTAVGSPTPSVRIGVTAPDAEQRPEGQTSRDSSLTRVAGTDLTGVFESRRRHHSCRAQCHANSPATRSATRNLTASDAS